MATYGVASALFVPLAFEGEVRLVAVLVSQTPRTFEENQVQLAYTLANQAMAALGTMEMRGRLNARAEQQAALARAAGAINARLDLRSVLSTLCREANLTLGADLAGVYLGTAETGGLAVAGHGMPDDSDWYGYVIRPGDGVGGQVLVTGKPAISNAYRDEVRLPENEALRAVQTAVAVPVSWDGELKGALSVGFHSMRRVTDDDLSYLQAIASLAAVASSNAEAFERAQTAARTDSLTGLLNHGALHMQMREEIARARRHREPLCCLLLDLDNFKPVNDLHGHVVGDELLGRVADAIREEFRQYDGIGRFGGDEFAVILPGVEESEARDAAARLRATVVAALDNGELEYRVTASVGIAPWHEPLTAVELLDRADRALLVAKGQGKDQATGGRPGDGLRAGAPRGRGRRARWRGERPLGHGQRLPRTQGGARQSGRLRAAVAGPGGGHARERRRPAGVARGAAAPGRRWHHSPQPHRPAPCAGHPSCR